MNNFHSNIDTSLSGSPASTSPFLAKAPNFYKNHESNSFLVRKEEKVSETLTHLDIPSFDKRKSNIVIK
jgi:hypothetical protein